MEWVPRRCRWLVEQLPRYRSDYDAVTGVDITANMLDIARELVPEGDFYVLVSHITDDQGNARGFERVAAHLTQERRLLLGIQDRHSGYSRSLGNGTTYTQRLLPLNGGFRKEYLLIEDGAAEAPNGAPGHRLPGVHLPGGPGPAVGVRAEARARGAEPWLQIPRVRLRHSQPCQEISNRSFSSVSNDRAR